MKINDNAIRNAQSTTTQPEAQNQPSALENATIQTRTTESSLAQQKMATESRSMSNLNASLLQVSLANALPSSQLLQKAAKEISPMFPQMLAQSQNDPDKFMYAITEKAKPYNILGDANNNDIMALAFLVMMEAAKSAREDLKSIMDGVKNINKNKEGMRELLIKFSDKPKPDDDD